MATKWTGWSEMPESGFRIGAHSEEVLLGVKPVMEVHHGRSIPGGKTFVAQRTGEVEDTVVPDTGIGIGSVMDEVLLRGGKPVQISNPTR